MSGCMCKEGWNEDRTGVVCVRLGGILKGSGIKKRGGETKILERGASWGKGWVP